MLRPRPYQRDAIDSIFSYFEKGGTGNPVVVMPTGSGKSLVQAVFQKEVLDRWPTQRFLLLTHVKELVEQNADKLRAIWPRAPLGIYSASLGRRDASRPMTMATIQSIYKMAAVVGHIDIVIIDECHLVPSTATTMYRAFLSDLMAINPKMKVIGLSATPYRLDSGWLHEGKDALFTDICFDLPVRRLIEEGWLCPLVSKGGAQEIDLSKVRTRAGEFAPDDVDKALHTNGVLEAALEEIIAYGKTRRSWLIFCASIASATEIADILSARGYPCGALDGTTSNAERESLIAQFRAGKIHLTNVNVLTTGFDAPGLDMEVILRATKSTGLYVQILGRGMRISPETGKTDCLVLDYGGNVERHGPVDDLVINWNKTGDGKKVGELPGAKKCPECFTMAPIYARKCVNEACAYQWEFKPGTPQHGTTATDLPILSTLSDPEWINVQHTSFGVHNKKGRPPSLRVEYICGSRVVSDWVCVEHEGYAREAAEAWFAKRGAVAPATATEALRVALGDAFPVTEAIQVRRSGKWEQIVNCKLRDSQ